MELIIVLLMSGQWHLTDSWALFQYLTRRLIERSRDVLKQRDLYLKLCDRSDIWQAPRQHCCWCACQVSNRCNNLKYQSHGFGTSRDHGIRRLIGYWHGALEATLICWEGEDLYYSVKSLYFGKQHMVEHYSSGIDCTRMIESVLVAPFTRWYD